MLTFPAAMTPSARLTARLAGAVRRSGSVRGDLQDGLAAVALAVLAVLLDLGHGQVTWHPYAWDVVLTAPLVLRRRHRTTVGIVVSALCLAQWVSGVLASGDLAVLVVLYTFGAHERRRWVLVTAIGVAELGVALAVSRWGLPRTRPLTALTLTGTVTAAWVAGLMMRMRRSSLAAILERAETAERERDTRAQIAVAVERTRMAREMHDVVAHSLAVMVTLTDAATTTTQMSQAARETVGQASDVGRQALAEMGRLLAVLRSGDNPLAPQPGALQVSDLLGPVRSAGLDIELVTTGDPGAFPTTTQLAMYRIVQESLTNVLKHGRNVRLVRVELTAAGGQIRVAVTDDGDPAPLAQVTAGHGLTGMRERAELFRGQLSAGPLDGHGWRVLATLEPQLQAGS